ncbi:MAG: hypothetical protein CO042_03525, partial [Parcubacteria group bacterium CG_4_9_14_0_2_um_filter_41_8]
DNFSYPAWDDSGKPLIREPIFNEQGLHRARAAYLNVSAGKRLVLKNPEFINRAPLISALFPDALVVVCVRHPLCALQSIAKCGNEKFMLKSQSHFGMADDLLLKAAATWKESFDTYHREKNANWIMVKYEDVVFDTEQTLTNLFKFLDIDDPEYLNIASKIPKDLNHSYYWVQKQLKKNEYQKEIQSLVAVGARELGYDFSFNHLNTKRPSFWHQGKSVHKQITKIASSAKKQAKQYIKKMLQWCHRFCGSEGVLISSTIFLSYASEDAVLLVERKVIEKALHMVCHKGRDLGIDFTLELLERDFFRLRGRKHIVLLDKDNSCIPSIILKNIFIYPKDLAAPKKTYVMQASIKYINKETYGI